jgi:organic radical activating enzyme
MTFACTGHCKHCALGEHPFKGEHIDSAAACDLIKKVASEYKISSIMTFGGEPLLFLDEVLSIQAAACDAGIENRQLITSGFFSSNKDIITYTAKSLAESGVNDLLLSVDAFHQESIPLETVMEFAKAVQAMDIPKFRVHPAWLVSEEDINPYNNKTREILEKFSEMGVPVSGGNVVYPGGRALKYLSEYFTSGIPQKSKYDQNPRDITTITVLPNGDILGDNIYRTDILEILARYMP